MAKLRLIRVPWLPAGAMAIHPFIFVRRHRLVDDGLMAHERLHCERQVAMGLLRWLWRYLTDTRFRYREELLGYRLELQIDDPPDRERRAAEMARSLAAYYHMKLDARQVKEDLLAE